MFNLKFRVATGEIENPMRIRALRKDIARVLTIITEKLKKVNRRKMPKKIYTGKVVSDKMDKTVVVAVTRLVQHPESKKTVKKVRSSRPMTKRINVKAGILSQ